MSVRDQLRRVSNRARTIPNKFGLRPYRVYVQQGTSTGAYEGRGALASTEVEVLNGEGTNTSPPKVRFLTDEERALGGYEIGTVRIGPVTPDYPGGGTLLSALSPGGTLNTDTVSVRLARDDGGSGTGFYRIKATHAERGIHYSLVCERAV